MRLFCILSSEAKNNPMTETLSDLVPYGYVALPLWVFAEHAG